jgi:hypothetical protein
VHDDVEAAHLRQPELTVVDAGEANFFPCSGAGGKKKNFKCLRLDY